ncbi:hemerythrin domain-containing protein [Sphingomonas naphthae]|uniref:Hemerythrin domain-containing protein n=1 Tax=Sphingomonas naphthae TaxID=1813468 RepID=A0ABY7TMR9_9SPHN|nr:hemerythrin domain-containing protein [Sphingomonas naphthae]WCT74051.1 hemerythrin domain-containing protein [Sphingomonas naphthae]
MATTAPTRRKTRTTAKAADTGFSTVAVAGAAAAGLFVGFAANFVRKAIVQAPTALAGDWAEALAAEHKATLALFDRIEETGEAQTSRRSFLLMQLKHALAKHALEEENAIYAALRDNGQTEEADKLNGDHGYVKQYLYDLTVMAKDSPAWIAKVAEFRRRLETHMQEEERDIFPALRHSLSDEQNHELFVAMNKEGLKIA